MQFNSLVASGSRITSIALSTLQSLCAIVAAQSSATTETIVLSPPVPTKCLFAATSQRAIAVALTARGVRTAGGGTRWHPEQVAST